MAKYRQTIEVERKLKEVGFQTADYKIRTDRQMNGHITGINFKIASTDKALQLRHALITRGLQVQIFYKQSGQVAFVSAEYYPGIEAKEKEISPNDDKQIA